MTCCKTIPRNIFDLVSGLWTIYEKNLIRKGLKNPKKLTMLRSFCYKVTFTKLRLRSKISCYSLKYWIFSLDVCCLRRSSRLIWLIYNLVQHMQWHSFMLVNSRSKCLLVWGKSMISIRNNATTSYTILILLQMGSMQ